MIGIEMCQEAVADAKVNAKLNGESAPRSSRTTQMLSLINTCSTTFARTHLCAFQVSVTSSSTAAERRTCSPTFSARWCRPMSRRLWTRRGQVYVSPQLPLWICQECYFLFIVVVVFCLFLDDRL